MESLARPIREFTDDLSWFVRARETRVFYVHTDADLRPTAIRLAAAQEMHPENPSPWAILEDPFTPDSDGWLARAERLRAQHAARRERMAEEGEPLPDLPPRPTAAEPLGVFGAQLAQLLDAKAAWHDGLVVVLAPARVYKPGAFRDAVCALVNAGSLHAVRWVLIDPEPGVLEPIADRVGEQAMRAIFLLDEAEAQRDLAQRIDAAERAPADISGPARVGAAWPTGVSPPPRPDRPPIDPEAIDELLCQEGIKLPLAGAIGTELSQAVLRGAQALRRGQTPLAVEHQARARDLCAEAELPREATIMELVLGAYLVAAGDLGRAARTYDAATERAEKANLPDLGAQAQIALGALHLRAGQKPDAAVSYARAAGLARASGSAILTIEALPLAAQAQLDVGNEGDAIHLFSAAIDAANARLSGASEEENALGAAEIKASSAAEVARALAALFRRRGLHERADELDELRREFE